VLKVEGLSSGYGKITVIRDISLEVSKGEIVGLLGPNGAGKTTLMLTLAGILHPSKGKIVFNGIEVTDMAPEKRARLGLSLVPQGRTVFPLMTVKENLEMGAYLTGKNADYGEVFELFPVLKQRANQLAGSLSGGEQKMLEIARALVSKPTLLMLDEPSLGLAPKVIDTLFSTISLYSKEKGIAVLIAEQNIYKTLKITKRIYVMNVGKVVAEGPSQEFMKAEKISNLYLGGIA